MTTLKEVVDFSYQAFMHIMANLPHEPASTPALEQKIVKAAKQSRAHAHHKAA